MTQFPRADADLIIRLNNYSAQIANLGSAVGLSTADVKSEQKRCTTIISAIQTCALKHNEWLSAVAAKDEIKKTELSEIRATLGRLKAARGFSKANRAALSSEGTGPPPPVSLENHKPVIRVRLQAGKVHIKFTRKPLDGVNLYTRKRGELSWRLLGKWNHSPCIDETPLATPGVPEVREYRVIGIKRDKEVGQPSDVVVVVAGE